MMFCQDRPLLKTEDLVKQFGGLKAVDSVSLSIHENELLALIGPNGAGKTTFINLVTGVLSPDRGRIWFNGRDITFLPTFERAKLGLVRTFQILRPFVSLSVRENVMVGFANHHCSRFLALLRNRNQLAIKNKIDNILISTGLERWATYKAGALPVGILRRVEIARALAANPRLLLLDEPAAGLNDQELQELSGIIFRLHNEYKLPILLVEHRMRFVMRTCRRIVVMHRGKIIAEGTPEDVASDPQVVEIYLGRKEGYG